nr:hypothetical protein Iba_chr04aCG25330 [Ipomoea batatas]
MFAEKAEKTEANDMVKQDKDRTVFRPYESPMRVSTIPPRKEPRKKKEEGKPNESVQCHEGVASVKMVMKAWEEAVILGGLNLGKQEFL